MLCLYGMVKRVNIHLGWVFTFLFQKQSYPKVKALFIGPYLTRILRNAHNTLILEIPYKKLKENKTEIDRDMLLSIFKDMRAILEPGRNSRKSSPRTEFVSSTSKATSFKNKVHRFMHHVISRSICGRFESSGKVNHVDMPCLYGMLKKDDHVDSLSPYFNYAGTDPLILLIQLFRAKFMDRVVRYKVIVRVADESGDAPILIWDRDCAELVGVSTGDLRLSTLSLGDTVSGDGQADYGAEDLSQGSGLEKLNGLDDFVEDLGDGSATLPLNRCLLKEFVYFC
nr:replication protein A 70 kDa DNA-binding subunit B-like [Ipomoea batatas]